MSPNIQLPGVGFAHVDFAPGKGCWNMEALCYGTCYGCGCCARDKRERWENRIRYLNERIEEEEHFDMWDDDPELRALQEGNRSKNIAWAKRRKRYYEKRVEGMDMTAKKGADNDQD